MIISYLTYTRRFFEILIEVESEFIKLFELNQMIPYTPEIRVKIALKLLEEENKDKRVTQMSNKPEKKITEAQIKFLKDLGIVNIPDNMTAKEASRLIDEKKAKKK